MSPCAVPALLQRRMDHSGATIFHEVGFEELGRSPIVIDLVDEWKTAFQDARSCMSVLTLLRKDSFYAATKKCVFMTPKVLFLWYVVSGEGIQVDKSKVADVQEWPTLTTITEVCNPGKKPDFNIHDGFSFKGNQLCIPNTSLRLKIIKELHGVGHVDNDRTLHWCSFLFFWPTMRKEKGFHSFCEDGDTQLNFSSAYHPQTDGQTEVVNRSLGNFLSTGFGPFQVVYAAQPRGPLDLMSLPVSGSVPKKVQDFVEGLREVHKAVRDNLVRANSKYKQDADQKRRQVDFEAGDFVWAVLTKDRFPVGEYNKLSAKKIGPLEIVEKINSNAYRLKLPSHIRCSDVFNVKHLLPYHGDSSDDDLVVNSRANFVYPGGNDAGPSIEERAILFLEAQDRVKKSPLFKRA
ncbi:putative reverse transcriptase domain-containing protein [Tanacetum coccineum]